ncbi:MAG: translation initiation factor IF-2, partial [Chitinophagaceae bacterium]
MAELKLPRLLAAAKEFNVGQDTLIDFLIAKGFPKDELKPTSKLTEEMYRSLQHEFQGDKAAKLKSDQLELPKGSQAETKKKKEDEEIVFKKDEKPVSKTPKKEPEPVPVTVVAEEVKEKEKTEVVAPVVIEAEKGEEEKKEADKKEDEIKKVDAPGIGGPKVITKIDLSTIDSSTRPKKTPKLKKEEAPKPVQEEKAAKNKLQKAKKEEVKEEKSVVAEIVEKVEPVTDEHPAVIENIEVEKLTGPKILGKIQLPVDNDTRPVKDEKKKRKRIPIEKKDVKREIFINKDTGGDRRPGGTGAGGGNFNRGRGPGTGGSAAGGNRRHGGASSGGRREDKLIDEKEIQKKIQETQAKLAGGGGKGKHMKAKLRREKRQELADAMGEGADDHKLQLTEFISVSELANLMDVSFAEVISKCMGLGIMVSINQRLDAEVIELVASEFGFDVEFIDMEKQMEMEEELEEDNEEDLRPRSPIVTIMGHVDHGKTSLLDHIRSANVVAGEAGGITQHIGAYQVELQNGKEITFLDTPGHEAFTAMRARGAKVTDIAVIVIAADDAVMPQTREAISHAQAAGVPMIFAINKIDKDGANSQRIYEQLSSMNLLVEEWGGKYQSQEIAAKKGLNIDKLLEKILLEAEILDLKANPEREATGTIIEASMDKGRGYVATLLVENGTLKPGDLIVSGQYFGRVKALFNERNKKEDKAGPSAPAVVLGLNGAPQAGEKFKVYED